MRYTVGIDASGGDNAPGAIVKGAVLAQKEALARIVLVGAKPEILKELKKCRAAADTFQIVDAPEKIAMEDKGAMSIRRKKNSSIVVGASLLKEKKIDAFVSCGNTAAVVSAAILKVRLIEGVERPGIAVFLPTACGASLIIDVGANIIPKPFHLLEYGVMASLYCELLLNKHNPTVGLLNIGEEEAKGPEFVKGVHGLFSQSNLNFIGNLEAKDIFSGKCDCVVCDGFVGNIVLKLSEGLAKTTKKFLVDAMKSSVMGRLGFLLSLNSLKQFKKRIDYAEYGGAPLLGIDGVVIIGHGRSNAYAVKNAVGAAVKELKHDVIGNIKGRLNEICKDSRLRQILAT